MQSQMTTSKYGGEIISYKLNGIERLHQGESVVDENGKAYWNRHSPILFPMVGKLRQNQTIINGRTYELSQHGFARDLEFEPISKLDNFHSYVLRSNEETKKRFPFDFSLYNTYRIDENKLTTIYRVVNDGNKKMIFGIGGHPAFKINQEDLINEEYFLEFEKDEEKLHFLYLVDGLVGTEYAKNRLVNKQRIQITKDSFKDDAIIMKGLTSNKISLKRRTGNKTLLTMDFSGFPYLAIWSKPGAPFICIEPWYSTADTVKSSGLFAQKQDLITLEQKQSFECRYTVEFF